MNISAPKIRFDVVGHIVSPLIIILVEIFWVYPWLIWSREMDVFPWDHNPVNIFSLIFLAAASYAITRYIPDRDRLMRLGKLALIIVLLGLMINFEYGGGLIPFSGAWLKHIAQLAVDSFSTLHPIIPAITASIYVSWRGMRIGGSDTYSTDVFRSFLIELFAVILLIIVWALTLGDEPAKSLVDNAGLYIAGFFFFGLTALAMGNFMNIRQKLLRQKSVPISNRRWFTILLLVIGGMVIIGIGISSLFTPDILDDTTSLFGQIVSYLQTAIRWIFIPLGYVVELIWAVMAYLLNLIRSPENFAEFEFPGWDEVEDLELINPQSGFDYTNMFKWIALIILIVFALFMLYKASKRLQSRMSDSGVEEFSESLWSWLGFKTDILLFFSKLFERWFGSRIQKIRDSLTSPSRKEEVLADDMDIREIYRHVLHEAELSGHKRHSYETPYEYAGRLDTSIPGINEQVDDITDLYVNVRYGESQMKDWETEHANVLFRLLRRFLRKPDRD